MDRKKYSAGQKTNREERLPFAKARTVTKKNYILKEECVTVTGLIGGL